MKTKIQDDRKRIVNFRFKDEIDWFKFKMIKSMRNNHYGALQKYRFNQEDVNDQGFG